MARARSHVLRPRRLLLVGMMGSGKSSVGRALADRIRHGATPHAQPDPVLYDELERVRHELGELQERVDFTERLLSQSQERQQVGRGGMDS